MLKSHLGLRGLSVTGIQLDDVVLVNQKRVECRLSKKSFGFRLLIRNCLASLRDPLGAGTKFRRIIAASIPSKISPSPLCQRGVRVGKKKFPL